MVDRSGPVDLAIAGLGPATLIGSGGFADVYRARQIGLDRDVAVKVLRAPADDELARTRFERECRAMGALSAHPNIVSVFDGGFTPDGRAYLVMEYCSGGSLHMRVRRDGVLSAMEATDVGRKVGRALEVAHQAGVLHRDIKAANILITPYGEPALADFGIARIEGSQHTTTGEVTASFAHAAPEILEGRPATPRADVFSLGSTLFELTIGRPPHFRPGDESVVALIRRATTEPIQDPATLGMPEPLAGVIRRACAYAIDDRYPSAAAMVADLEAPHRTGSPSRSATANPALATRSLGPDAYLAAPPSTHDAPTLEPGGMPAPSAHRAVTEAAVGPVSGVVPTMPGTGSTADPPGPQYLTAEAATTSLDQGSVGPGPAAAPANDRIVTPVAPMGPSPAGAVGPSRRGGGRRLLVAVAVVLGLAAVGLAAGLTLPTDADDAATDPTGTAMSVSGTADTALALAFDEAADGPVRSGESYTLTVDGADPAAGYRLIEDGSAVAEGSGPFTYTPVRGRHELQLESSTDPAVRSAPLELYAIGELPPAGYRVNLASVPNGPGNWPVALARFDELVAAGHTDLELLPSDWFPNLTPGYWNLFVPGFGDQPTLGVAYCDSFGLAVPDDCFTSFFDPDG
ncbi:MAG: protein kinase domain-containing protein [Acidimicrobiales bacterium]